MARPLLVGVQLPEVERRVPWPELISMTKAAEDAGLAWVGETTGAAQARGTLLIAAVGLMVAVPLGLHQPRRHRRVVEHTETAALVRIRMVGAAGDVAGQISAAGLRARALLQAAAGCGRRRFLGTGLARLRALGLSAADAEPLWAHFDAAERAGIGSRLPYWVFEGAP